MKMWGRSIPRLANSLWFAFDKVFCVLLLLSFLFVSTCSMKFQREINSVILNKAIPFFL